MTFARLRDGLSYPGNVVLNVPGQKMQVVIQNSGYQRVTPAAPAQAPAKPSASDASIDTLTGPIALYPDALIAQVLEGSKDVAAVQKFAGWLKGNSALTGTALQDAAQKAGFATCYVALAPFPQVIQLMVEKPDWTAALGKAYSTDQAAVYGSIQRLRAAAMALGNLKTTPQQEVVKETAATGQTIILVQPANPQVVYVPVYNTQVVYVQSAPPPSSANVAGAAMIGFTAGIIIGASSNHYYAGPYAWRGGAAHYAYERREDYVDYRQDVYEDRADNRQDAYENRADNRQDAYENRPGTAQQNQSQRQSTAQANQSTRQSTAQANQGTRQSGATASTASASGSRAGGASSYQSGGAAKAQSARGSASRASSRSSGGSRRR